MIRVSFFFGVGILLVSLGLYISGYGWTHNMMAMASFGVLIAFIGIIIMIVGVIAGLVLVMQSKVRDQKVA